MSAPTRLFVRWVLCGMQTYGQTLRGVMDEIARLSFEKSMPEMQC